MSREPGYEDIWLANPPEGIDMDLCRGCGCEAESALLALHEGLCPDCAQECHDLGLLLESAEAALVVAASDRTRALAGLAKLINR